MSGVRMSQTCQSTPGNPLSNKTVRLSQGTVAISLLLLLGWSHASYALSQTRSATGYCSSSGQGSNWNALAYVGDSDDWYNWLWLNSNSSSKYMECTGFDFSIPDTATINGIKLNIERRAQYNDYMRDKNVELIKDGTILHQSDKADTSTFYTTSDVVVSYGSATDLWKTNWTAADINSSDFGIAFSVRNDSNNGWAWAAVDYIAITVDYTEIDTPPTIKQSAGACASMNQVSVIFSEDLDQATAEARSNYTLDNGVTVSSATLQADNRTVQLNTSPLVGGASYVITVNNVEDLTGNPVATDSTSAFTMNCSGLIAYYQFDEESWDGTANEIVDQSVNGLHGRSVGGASTAEAKICNGAILDGITLAYAEIPDHHLLDIADELTVSTWINSNVIPSRGLKSILSKDENYEFHIATGGRINWWWRSATGATRQIFTSRTISTGSWHYITIVYSRSGRYQRIYIDGVDGGNSTSHNESLMQNNDPLQIGGDQYYYSREFDGLIDEVRIYERALSQAEIIADMNATHPCSAPVACSFRDNFSSVSYSNNDGTLTWSNAWQENNDNNNPASGDAYIYGGKMVLSNSGGGNHPELVRELDLKGASSATLEFGYHTSNNLENTDAFEALVSGDGGLNWRSLYTLANDGSGTQSLDISTEISSNTQIKLRPASGYTGSGERISFYYVAVVPQGLCGGSLDHFNIDTGGADASTCTAKTITITARDSNNNILTNYTGTPSISTSTNHGNWSENTTTPPQGTLNPNPDNDNNGVVNYAFVSADNSRVSLDLNNSHADDLTITVADAVEGVSSSSATVNFRDNAFVITEDPITVAGKPQSISVAMWRKDPSTGVCSIATGYNNSSQPIKAWIDRGGELTSAADPTIGNLTLPENQPAASNLNLDFSSGGSGAGGEADFILDTTDVGQYTLTLLDDSNSFASAEDIIGSSSTLTVEPFGFDLDFDNDRQNNGTAGASYAIDHSGSVFTSAGTDFSMQLTAVLWQSDDDTNSDGIPDNGADLSDNTAALSFGQENTGPSVNYSYTLMSPAMGDGGALTISDSDQVGSLKTGQNLTLNFTSAEFNNGQASNTLNWSEVGVIGITATLNDYLGDTGSDINGSVSNVGRFSADSFSVSLSDGEFLPSSNTFTYIGQDFVYNTAPTVTITALAAGGSPLRNYEDNYWMLSNNISWNGTNTFKYSDNANKGAGLLAPTTDIDFPADLSDVNGSITSVVHSGVSFQYLRPDAPIAPFDADIKLEVTVKDSDGATGSASLAHIAFSGDTLNGEADHNVTNDSLLRYGRATIKNTTAIGTTRDTTAYVPLDIQYYNGIDFVSNNDDISTSVTHNSSASVFDSIDPDIVNDTLTPDKVDIADTIAMHDDKFPFTLNSDINAQGGSLIYLLKSIVSYLQFDWNGNGSIESSDMASASVTFAPPSFYHGDKRFIMWHETR